LLGDAEGAGEIDLLGVHSVAVAPLLRLSLAGQCQQWVESGHHDTACQPFRRPLTPPPDGQQFEYQAKEGSGIM
jgi:hypothetical protein